MDEPAGKLLTMLAAVLSASMATSRSEKATAPLARTMRAVTPMEASRKTRDWERLVPIQMKLEGNLQQRC